ncbi:cobalt-zinc-cadmium efflux system protein [Quadrisphaera granulorum]|uniref:Cobalt-zinc-cadmium efflux system protein n=1 Tax=Quadrisphaera granulorum TaxID=317664 RepID=A0A315ZI21_9ACTN|nr:cation diffusion facilitator family transporter [Quadrisphaera granulorum]PWJ45171.1 cobalt-zinc-cadmium efflux system protein [Quadrisphaera granulorum]SZE99180.1 cobalt-zinc-cadmium efflux system protein [Quadrisphaera granulorum]
MSHGHSHGAAAGGDRRRLALALAVTLVVLVTGVIGGIVTGSLALLADAGHMLTDAAGLGIALLASSLALRPATAARTWGLQRAEVLAAVLQAALLLAVGVLIAVEGVRRLLAPPEVASAGMLVFGAIGLVGNAISLWILTRRSADHHDDGHARPDAEAHVDRPIGLNRRAAVLEVISDGLGSVAVLVAAGVIALTGWTRADALVSLLIGLLIVPRTLVLLREATDVLLEAVPRGLDLTAVRQHLLEQPHVLAVHDLHASQISSGLPVLSAHIVLDDSCFVDGHAPEVLDQLQACVAGHFPVSITHSTFQVEPASHADHEHGVHA